jgi:hypothetical protein
MKFRTSACKLRVPAPAAVVSSLRRGQRSGTGHYSALRGVHHPCFLGHRAESLFVVSWRWAHSPPSMQKGRRARYRGWDKHGRAQDIRLYQAAFGYTLSRSSASPWPARSRQSACSRRALRTHSSSATRPSPKRGGKRRRELSQAFCELGGFGGRDADTMPLRLLPGPDNSACDSSPSLERRACCWPSHYYL